MTDCPHPSALEAFLADPDPTVAGHVETCRGCQAALDALTAPTFAPPPPDPFAAERGLGRAVSALLARPAAALPYLDPPEVPGELGRLGPHRVLRVLGRGGVGVVFLARDDRLGREVAIKVLRPEFADEDGRSRFRREAGAAAAIRHDGVVVPLELGELADGSPFLVMEFVPGGTLRDRIRAGPVPPKAAAEWVAQAADGLHAAHAAGLVHRDVKPANILIDDATGRAKVTDFGLARPLDDAARLTATGELLGTPAYMAPEQLADADTVDPRTDVYGLGATLYEGLSGVVPFRGPVPVVLRQVAADDPLPPRRLNPGVPRDLETICLRAMAKEPHRRYPTAADLRDDLRRWLRGEPIAARPVGAVGRAWRWARRNRLAAGLGVALGVLFVGTLAAVTALWLKASASAASARAERDQADDDYRRAERVVGRFYDKLYREGTLAAPVSMETRRELVREAIRFYHEVAARRPAERTAADLAVAHARLGWMQNQLRDPDSALAAYRTAAAQFADAVRGGGADAALLRERAECHFHIGVTAARLGRPGDAAAAYEQAAGLLRELLAGTPRDEKLRSFLAGCLGNAGVVDEFRGDVPRAVAAHEEARRLLADLRAERPDDAGYLQDLFWETLALGELMADANAALRELEAADALAAECATRHPTDYNTVRVRCAGKTQLALGLMNVGRAADALIAATAGTKYAVTLSKFPSPFDAVGTQARAWAALGDARKAIGDPARLAAWQKAAELFASLPRRSVADHTYAVRLAEVYEKLAAEGGPEGAAFGDRANEIRARLRVSFPSNPTFR